MNEHLIVDETFDSTITPDESIVLDALDGYSRFIDELFDQPKTRTAAWEGNVGSIAVRSVGRTILKWRHANSEDQPPLSLIVRLSRKLGGIVSEIAGNPRKVLQRQRTMEPVNRFRELDPSCVRWLVRQPGSTIVEKAGHRRQILAIRRFESANTLENRVLVDLLKRCRVLATDYLRLYAVRFPGHAWIQNVQRFKRVCDQYVDAPELADINPLPAIPQPNYVLLHEARYHEIWLAYVQVIRQQQRRQQLWKHRQTIWTEMCILAIWSSVSRQQRKKRQLTYRSDLWLNDTPIGGGFFDWASCPSDWRVGFNRSVAILPRAICSRRFPDLTFDYDFSVLSLSAIQPDVCDRADVNVTLPKGNAKSKELDATVTISINEHLSMKQVPLDLLKFPSFFDDKLNEFFGL